MLLNNNTSTITSQVVELVNIPIDRLVKIVDYNIRNLHISRSPKSKRQLSIMKQTFFFWMNGKVLYKSEFTLGDEYGVSRIR